MRLIYDYSPEIPVPDNSQFAKVVHSFLLTPDEKIFLIKGDRGLWSPISEKTELNEGFIDAAVRGAHEELGIEIDNIFLTDHLSSGISPTGKILQIHQCLGSFPRDFRISHLVVNDEVLDADLFAPLDALRILQKEGFQEGVNGLSHILRKGLTQLFLPRYVLEGRHQDSPIRTERR